MPLTDAQHDAIHLHDYNLIVVAGAGSGKTFVLVERYLALLEAHPDWQLNALVAITFTQKAAQEMRDRVRLHLQQQVDSATDETAASWANRLAAMDSARIDTIHGLCASILRANAAEAGVDPGFTVLDEIEARVLLDDALDDAFRSLGSNDPVLELFAEYGESAVRSELARLITADFGVVPDDLFMFWLEQWERDAEDHLRRFRMWYSDSEFAHWSYGLPDGDKLAVVWQTCADLLAQTSEETELDSRVAALRQLKPVIDLRVGAAGAWGGKETLQTVKAILRTLREQSEACSGAIGAPPGVHDQRAARLLPLWVALTQRVREVYRRAKDARGVLDFDDLESLTRDLLANDDVRARYLGAEFQHVLVDEFQDTNAAQWAIIRRLADPQRPGCLFVVGDPKQSIYGFRGADVSVFQQVRDVVAAQREAVALSTSFRTHEKLVRCFNRLFERILIRDPDSPVAGFEVEFDGMSAHRVESPSDTPPLELLLFDKARLTAEQEDESSVREWEAAAIARRVRLMVEAEQRTVYDKRTGGVRPLRYGDVALLFQVMTHVMVYEAALKREGIPYLTVAGKGYYDRQEVWDLLNLLRALDNPADTLALATALRSPLFSLSDDALLALRLSAHTEQPLSLWDALRQPEYVPADEIEQVAFAHRTLVNLRRRAGRVTIAELLRDALEETGYLAVLTGLPDGKRKRGNVEKLLEKAETSGRITLSAFTRYLRDMSENEAREGEAMLDSEGAVQLMSVHKSKGLEFPLVVLVDSAYERRGGAGGLVSGMACKVNDPDENKFVSTFAYRQAERLAGLRETAERRRLLYVAATRAQDYLLVSGQVTCRDERISAKGWLGWSLDALDAGELAPEDQILDIGGSSVQISFAEPVHVGFGDERIVAWDDLPAASPRLPLLERVERRVNAPTQTLAATAIADLGSALYASDAETREFYMQRWWRRVFHDAPARLDPVQLTTALKLGEIVHRAVRWELPERDDDLRELLRRYAWEEGIVDDVQNRESVASAYELLQRVRRSDVFAWVAAARVVYREVPFVQRMGERTIHGVIDLLMEDETNQWRLVDYKTNWLGESVTEADLAEHARRYHLQAGVYAAAVQALIGTPPLVYIHYIRYAYTVIIPEPDWMWALAELETYIGDVSEHG